VHRQFSARNEDAGFTLVEVVVAMLVFAIIATGFLMTVTASLVTTRDTRTRIVAANLASQQIDLLRSQSVFEVTNSTRDISLNGDTFHVAVGWEWQTNGGAAATCEGGEDTGSLAYKRVTVTVTWDNMPAGKPAVYADTALAPRSKINDPTRGTILVGVIDAAGVGVSGATVSLSPANGVASATTDSDGCAYLFKVPPDDYTVSISKSGYVNDQHLTTPSAATNVDAGSTARVSFAYDKATTFRLTYANPSGGNPKLPTNLTTTFVSTYGASTVTSTTADNPKDIARFPLPSGYSVLPGTYSENPAARCLAPDPGQWPVAADGRIGKRPDAVAGAGGATVAVAVPMGVVKLTGLSGSSKFLTAVYVGGGDGDPGCSLSPAPKYTFNDNVISSNAATIALPYGTYKIYRGSTLGALTTQLTSGISLGTLGTLLGIGANTTVTLDPRVAP